MRFSPKTGAQYYIGQNFVSPIYDPPVITLNHFHRIPWTFTSHPWEYNLINQNTFQCHFIEHWTNDRDMAKDQEREEEVGAVGMK